MLTNTIDGDLQGDKVLAATAFNAHIIPSVAYTYPKMRRTEDQAKAQADLHRCNLQ